MPAGTALVLLHPFPFDASFWDGAIGALTRADVCAYEAPGFGGRPVPIGWQIADWADDVADRIAATDARSAVVCGLSMGGYAALALADRRPEVVAGLVLADTRAEADTPDARAGRDAGIARIEAGDYAGWADDLLGKVVSPTAADDVRGALRMQMRRQDAAAVCEALKALRDRPDRTGDLARVTVPTLVVVGADDAVTPPAAAATLHEGIPGARLEVLADAGHLSAAERPEAFAAVVDDFLKGLG
mgnify:CR=1 FL=1